MLGVAATQVTVANLANSSQERNAIVVANEDGTLSRYEVGEATLTSSDCDAAGSQAVCYGPQSNAHGNFSTAIGYAAHSPEKLWNSIGLLRQCQWPKIIALGANSNAIGNVGHRHRH